MKTKTTVWKRLSLMMLLFISTSVVILYSCEKENIQPIRQDQVKTQAPLPQEISNQKDICGRVVISDLLNEEGKIKVGDVYAFNDTKYFYLYVIAKKGYTIKNAYFFVGTREELPLTFRGDLDFKDFNHNIYSRDFVRLRSFKIPLTEMHKLSTMSLMVQTRNNLIPNQFDNLSRSWADGKEVGSLYNGRIFSYEETLCMVNDPISVNE